MTLCNWQNCHQTHVLCGCTTFDTESNHIRAVTEGGGVPLMRAGLLVGLGLMQRDDHWRPSSSGRSMSMTLSEGGGGVAGYKVLYTCTSRYAHAAMCGGPARENSMDFV